jgi:hypothetical protein
MLCDRHVVAGPLDKDGLMTNWIIAAGAALAIAAPLATPALAQPAANGQTAPLLVPFTDHYTMRVERPARDVWAHLKTLYVAGERSRQQGYQVSSLTTDPAAWLGGTVAVAPTKSDRPKVTIRVSALDEEAMVMTLFIELENPVPVYVVHQVRPDGDKAAIYQTIIQTQWPITAKPGETQTRDSVKAAMTAVVKQHNEEVAAIMQKEKAIMEKAQ